MVIGIMCNDESSKDDGDISQAFFPLFEAFRDGRVDYPKKSIVCLLVVVVIVVVVVAVV